MKKYENWIIAILIMILITFLLFEHSDMKDRLIRIENGIEQTKSKIVFPGAIDSKPVNESRSVCDLKADGQIINIISKETEWNISDATFKNCDIFIAKINPIKISHVDFVGCRFNIDLDTIFKICEGCTFDRCDFGISGIRFLGGSYDFMFREK